MSLITRPNDIPFQRALGERYRLIERIGRGGSAVVHLAHDAKHDRQVALKVLLPHDEDEGMLGRFHREIRIVARLSHPHILPLLDSGEAAGLPYFVMPFVEGAALQARLDGGRPLPLHEAIRIACEIADALEYAHAAGVVHRDIKPGNVLLAGHHALVVDFGAGQLMRPSLTETYRTQQGMLIGTPLYMSPEQFDPEQRLDGRSDIYSLGCVLYEMLTGRPPYLGRSLVEMMSLRLSSDPRPPSELRAEIPEYVERAVLRALQREADARFAGAADFIAALDPQGMAHSWEVTRPAATPYAKGGGPAARSRVSPESGARSARVRPSVGVLPFRALDDERSAEHIASGLTEEIALALDRLRNLRVVMISSRAGDGAEPAEPYALGRRLGVETVLDGSLRRAGDRVRVSVRLTSTEDGTQLWSEQLSRELDDIFALQEEVARAVATHLEVRLLGQEMGPLVGIPTSNPGAHELYLRGRHAWSKRTEEQLLLSVDYFERAVALDPQFAQAHAALADARLALGLYGARAPEDVMPAARRAAERALALNPTLGEAHASLGCILALHAWDWEAAARSFAHAIALNPGYPTAHHWYGVHVLVPLGRTDDALTAVRRALALDPLSPAIASSVGAVLFAAGRFQESAREQERVIQTEPHFALAHHLLGQALVPLGEQERAIRAFARSLELAPGSSEVQAALVHALGRAGRRREAETLLAELVATSARRYVSPYLLAVAHLGLEDHDSALAALERACRSRAPELTWAGVRPVFDPIRDDPRFQAILREVGIPGRR